MHARNFMCFVSNRWEPDICVGWEVQMHSWGYLLQRAAHLNMNLCAEMSRIPGTSMGLILHSALHYFIEAHMILTLKQTMQPPLSLRHTCLSASLIPLVYW